jgi:hypothetical protein
LKSPLLPILHHPSVIRNIFVAGGNIPGHQQNLPADVQNLRENLKSVLLDVQKVYQDALNLSEDVFYLSVDVFNIPQDVKNVLFEVKNVAEDLKNVSFEVISLLLDVLKSSRRLVDGNLFLDGFGNGLRFGSPALPFAAGEAGFQVLENRLCPRDVVFRRGLNIMANFF